MAEAENKPACYGILDEVFPMGEDDLRSIKPGCFECPFLKTCLKAAVDSPDGLEMRARRLEAMAPAGQGLWGFVSRWSELKLLRGRAAGRVNKKRKT